MLFPAAGRNRHMSQQANVTKENDVWVLRIEKDNGKQQEYRCATENQARQLAMILSRPDTGGPPRQPAGPR
ncbi:hypothetical protein MXAN_5973 [Myxococcus xanthus DK 1622]|uniref:Uncharacterized protein n=3 Tax=Myxococcus TaxID=32 RepID=Q1CZR5_MYXXD|nr:hypothetical protein MXAN_5973 [Myxococcus xanthus DK 1622]NOJ56504.1 hypothetical protein [Myxococcus xanthus]QVW67448.1 hypothetical protein JTM82_34860 [Myxococcus xanthus DZ2]NOJ83732.1 hypothetical protein [Myxococcus xanthus]NOJ90812.1 hypothetical protein [Myxococcus xanthus]